MRRIAVVLLACVGILLVAGAAPAEHEVFYRYTILGYVKDAKGRAVKDREITVTRDKTGFSYLAQTDARGLYVLVLRLGDESNGERLVVRAGPATARVTVQFDPENRTDERGTRLDLDDGRFAERAAWFASTLALFLGASRP
jgi:hypothetical protein